MDIAVIGMHCRLPGANNVNEFWSLINRSEQHFSSQADRPFAKKLRESCQRLALNSESVMTAGLIDSPYAFDDAFFNISGKEAEAFDPQGRLLLECTNQLLENAYLNRQQLAGSKTGVFIGLSSSDYLQDMLVNLNPDEALDIYHATGNSSSSIVGRLAYFFDWKGPALAVDTACSSSLVSIAQACQSLTAGEVNMAVAGGVNLLLSHISSITFSQANMTSPTGQCKPFDKGANGYVRGEGCSLVLLKRLEDAVRDDDMIYAVIKSCKTNQDGRSNGITAPNSKAQEDLITDCWAGQGIENKGIAYVEAHGTGTRLGDPIEIKALSAVIKHYGLTDVPVGSVKSNIGHLEAAAGATGLIKSILVGRHRHIPAQANLQEKNPLLSRYKNQVQFCQAPVTIHAEKPLVCVSSFGFSGTNAHALLEIMPDDEHVPQKNPVPVVVGISAKSKERLIRKLHGLHDVIGQSARLESMYSIAAECQYTEQFSQRVACVSTGKDDFLTSIQHSIATLNQNSDDIYAALRDKKLQFYVEKRNPVEALNQAYCAFQPYASFQAALQQYGDQSLTEPLHYSTTAYGLIRLLLGCSTNIPVNKLDLEKLDSVQALSNCIALMNHYGAAGSTDTRSENSPEDSSENSSENSLTVYVGDDLKILDRRFLPIYGEDSFTNTAITLGILYCCNQITHIPHYTVSKIPSKELDLCSYKRNYLYHGFVRHEQLVAAPSEKEAVIPTRHYTDEWVAVSEPRGNVSLLQEIPCLLINDHHLQTRETAGEALSHHLPEIFHAVTEQTLLTTAPSMQCNVLIYAAAQTLDDVLNAVIQVAAIYAELKYHRSKASSQHTHEKFKFHAMVDTATATGQVLYDALAGLFATLALEDPVGCGLLIACDNCTADINWTRLGALLTSPLADSEIQVKLTIDKVFVKKLVRSEAVDADHENTKQCEEKARSLQQDCIIVSGGSSGIGFNVVENLVQHKAAQKIIVLGRRDLSSTIEQLMAEAERHHITCQYIQCDISDPATYGDALLGATENCKHIQLVHAANDDGQSLQLNTIVDADAETSVLETRVPETSATETRVLETSVLETRVTKTITAELKKVWSPKVSGLLHLTSLLQGRLSSVYLFSSISALWGMSGKSAYASANGFLKGVVSSGVLTETGIAQTTACHLWGIWEDSGMFDRASDNTSLASVGLGAHSQADGLQIIRHVMGKQAGPSVVAALDEIRLPSMLTKAKSLFSDLKMQSNADGQRKGNQTDRQQLKSPADMMAFIEHYLINEEKLALTIPDDRTKGFFDLGINSLVIADLCYRITKNYAVNLSVTDIFNAPTIEQLSEFIFTQYNEK